MRVSRIGMKSIFDWIATSQAMGKKIETAALLVTAALKSTTTKYVPAMRPVWLPAAASTIHCKARSRKRLWFLHNVKIRLTPATIFAPPESVSASERPNPTAIMMRRSILAPFLKNLGFRNYKQA